MHTEKSVDYILINLFNITSIFENEISDICNNPFMILPHNCDLNNYVLAVGCMIDMHGGNDNSWYKKSMHNDNSCTFNTSQDDFCSIKILPASCLSYSNYEDYVFIF